MILSNIFREVISAGLKAISIILMLISLSKSYGKWLMIVKVYLSMANTSDNWQDNYICDIKELEMPKGIFEAFKYYFKDLDIKNLDVFRDLYFGLKRRRLRQGYGELYNIKVDDTDISSDDCIENYLEFKDEEPGIMDHKYIRDMTEKYGDYRKVYIKNNLLSRKIK